jgi:hypothetical protein
MLERLDAVTVPEVRAEGVRSALFDPRASERVFQLLYAGGLTVQGVHDEAQRVWRASQPGRTRQSSAPTGLPSTI